MISSSFVRAAWLRPECRIIDTANWFQVQTNRAAAPLLNTVRRAILPDVGAASIIDEVLADHSARGVPLSWTVTPLCPPRGLVARLAKRGLEVTGRSSGMFRSTLGPPQAQAGLEFRKISAAGIGACVQIMASGWGLRPALAEGFWDHVRRSLETDPELDYDVTCIDGGPPAPGRFAGCPTVAASWAAALPNATAATAATEPGSRHGSAPWPLEASTPRLWSRTRAPRRPSAPA